MQETTSSRGKINVNSSTKMHYTVAVKGRRLIVGEARFTILVMGLLAPGLARKARRSDISIIFHNHS